nr:DUF1887 family CARF protein [Ferrithrix thermotolerans]
MSFVSEEALPNAIAVHEDKPDTLLLVSSTKMAQGRRDLAQRDYFRDKGLDVHLFGQGARITDFREAAECAREVVNFLRDLKEVEAITLNLTGGPKTTTIVFLDSMNQFVQMCKYTSWLYVDTQEGVTWRAANDQTYVDNPFTSFITVSDYLRLQGYESEAQCDQAVFSAAMDRREITNSLAQSDRDRRGRDLIGELNHCYSRAEINGSFIRNPSHVIDLNRKQDIDLLKMISDHGLLKVEFQGQPKKRFSITFNDSDLARYLGGGWLEEYVWLETKAALERLRVDATVLKNVIVTPVGGGPDESNEIDLLVLFQNRMLVMECKASKKPGGNGGINVSKLVDLAKKVGGRLATPWFVTAATDNSLPKERSRGVEYFESKDLPDLASRFIDWLGVTRGSRDSR